MNHFVNVKYLKFVTSNYYHILLNCEYLVMETNIPSKIKLEFPDYSQLFLILFVSVINYSQYYIAT